MAQTSKFNIVRKHRGDVSIFKRELDRKIAISELKHLKNLARNSGGRVFFEMVEVPYELTEAGKAEAKAKAEIAELDAWADKMLAEREAFIAACAHKLDSDGWCSECMSVVALAEVAA